jgi:hypothetical protein
MNEIDNFNVFVFCSGDVTADGPLACQENSLIDFSYIVIDDSCRVSLEVDSLGVYSIMFQQLS